ncbi:MAG: hypothetical protein AB2672_13430 [Candidatus Thiodiazotropha endolucinida]
MKYRSTAKWDSVENSKNLLYFAQLVDELLFDFSLDTYKPSAMNASLLCREAWETISEINDGNIKAPNLQHILDELCVNLSKDIVARSLIRVDTDVIFSVLKNPKEDVQEKRIIVEILGRQLSLVKYKKKNEKLLTDTITDSTTNFPIIRTLTRSYITTLVNIGFSAKYVYRVAKQFFFYGSNRIAGNSAITDFLEAFSSDANKFSVIYRGSNDFSSVASSCDKLNIRVSDELSGVAADISGFNFSLRQNEVYLIVSGISAKDRYVAHKMAESTLELLGTLYTLFHHKEKLKFLEECIIIDETTGEAHGSKSHLNNMHKCVDLIPTKASSKLNAFIADFSLESLSFKKFTRSAELHSLALASDSSENQMINLWIALESIIPAKSDSANKSSIVHIIDSITPFLGLVYIDRLVGRFAKDLINWNRRAVFQKLNGIKGKGLAQKLVKLLALPEYKASRDALSTELGSFHLLADRYEYFSEVFSSPRNVAKMLDNHNKRVAWQIRRIYRARNLIVHSGKTPSYTNILIENAHDYLDIVMGSLMKLATKPKEIMSIEQGFKYADLSYRSIYKSLSKKGAVFTDENINRMIEKSVI